MDVLAIHESVYMEWVWQSSCRHLRKTNTKYSKTIVPHLFIWVFVAILSIFQLIHDTTVILL